MKTTALIIEYLVAGILFLLASILLGNIIDPKAIKELIGFINKSISNAALITMISTAVSYALGIVLEPVSRFIFEKTLQVYIYKKRFVNYVEKHRSELYKSPILTRYDPEKKEEKDVKVNKKNGDKGKKKKLNKDSLLAMGEMRFYVLMKSERLYREIESQLNRLRLIRMLALIESIFLVDLIILIIIDSSALMLYLFVIIICILGITIFSIYQRLKRYYRAVERSYEGLVFDQYGIYVGNPSISNE